MKPIERSTLFLSLASFAVVLVTLVVFTLSLDDGHFVYALDDPYISLAMARNLAHHGTFGVSPGVYESAATSPLWVLLLTPFALLGDRALLFAPLVLNALCATWILIVFARLDFFRFPATRIAHITTAALLAVALFLPALCLIGMEHGLQGALTLYLVICMGADPFAKGARPRVRFLMALATLAALRPEAGFVAVGLGIAHLAWPAPGTSRLLKTRLLDVAWMALCSATPMIAYAAVNRAHGQYTLPNSLVVKTGFGLVPMSDLVPSAQRLHSIHDDAMLLGLVLITLGYTIVSPLGARHRRSALAFLVAYVCQVAVGGLFGMHRYVAYLVVCGAWVVLAAAGEALSLDRARASRSFATILAAILPLRLYGITANLPAATNDIYRQPVMIGRFLADNYDGDPVFVRDLGCAAWFHRGLVVDLMGFGSNAILRAMQAGRYDGRFVEEYARELGVRVIVANEEDIPMPQPAPWTKVAEWTAAPRGMIATLARHTVAFYAPSRGEAASLRQKLVAFEPSLSSGVEVRYFEDGVVPHEP